MSRTLLKAALVVVLLPALAAAKSAVIPSMQFNAQMNALKVNLLKNASTVGTKSYNEREILVRLLDDRDPAVRIAALKSLKNYVTQTSRVRDRVLRVYRDSSEKIEVRIQAAKTLLFASHYNDVWDRLLSIARYDNNTALRAISYKALYFQAAGNNRVRDRLKDAARNESNKEVRLAAVWGLFAATGDNRTRDILVNLARRDSDMDIRVEALKSLYNGMGNWRLADMVRDTARNTSTDERLRLPSILLLSRLQDSRTRDILINLARSERNTVLRQAAITAMNPNDESIWEYFHLIRRDQQGRLIDPLENE